MKILNFGSINIDHVYHVDTFVRPGETKLSQSHQMLAGGKGFNQSIALARAGAEVYHAGRMGRRDGFLTNLMRESGVRTDFVRQTGSDTGHAIIQVDDSGQNCILLCSGANFEMTEPFIDEVLSRFGEGDILLLQNEINLIGRIIESAYGRGLRICLNPSPVSDSLLRLPLEKVSCFVMNEIEGRQLAGVEDLDAVPRRMVEKYPGCSVVLTLGKEGVIYYDERQEVRHGIYDVPVVDTTGAGDTFTGYFLDSICRGLDVARALERASIASSISVSRNGAAIAIPRAEEVEQMRSVFRLA